MCYIKQVPLASSAREPRVVKCGRVRSHERLHRRRFALTLATRASPRSEERKIELGDLDTVTVREDLQERPPVTAVAHAAGDLVGRVVPPNAAEG